MSGPTPVASFIGGVGLAVFVHALYVLNDRVLGVSNFIHGSFRGDKELMTGVAGLVLGGILAGLAENWQNSNTTIPVHDVWKITVPAAFLVGLGSKLANGCTSGHMLVGISRLSPRSFAATATFVLFGSISTSLVHGEYLASKPSAPAADWSFGRLPQILLALQAIPLAISVALYLTLPHSEQLPTETDPLIQKQASANKPNLRLIRRRIGVFVNAIGFALALRLSNLTDPIRVINFLATPLYPAFDYSLACLALGALPLGIFLHRHGQPQVATKLTAQANRPKIDARLLIGSALFGVGWSAAGICPGPALVNTGRALFSQTSSELLLPLVWLSFYVIGGLVAAAF